MSDHFCSEGEVHRRQHGLSQPGCHSDTTGCREPAEAGKQPHTYPGSDVCSGRRGFIHSADEGLSASVTTGSLAALCLLTDPPRTALSSPASPELCRPHREGENPFLSGDVQREEPGSLEMTTIVLTRAPPP